jgi:hypothetical protein
MPIGIRIVEVPREPLSIAYRRKEQNYILAKSKPTIRKRGGL